MIAPLLSVSGLVGARVHLIEQPGGFGNPPLQPAGGPMWQSAAIAAY